MRSALNERGTPEFDEIFALNKTLNSKFWTVAFQLWPCADHLRTLMLGEREWSESECVTFVLRERPGQQVSVMNDFLPLAFILPPGAPTMPWIDVSLNRAKAGATPALVHGLVEHEHMLLVAQTNVIDRMLQAHMRNCCVHRGQRWFDGDGDGDGNSKQPENKKTKTVDPSMPECSCASLFPKLFAGRVPDTGEAAANVVAAANLSLACVDNAWRFKTEPFVKFCDTESESNFMSDSVEYADHKKVRVHTHVSSLPAACVVCVSTV